MRRVLNIPDHEKRDMIDWNNISTEITSDALAQQSVRALDEQVRRLYPATQNLMLISNGELVLTRRYDSNVTLVQKKPVRSVTKSVMSSLIGIALDQGKIKSTDQTLKQLLPNSAAGAAGGRLTLHQILSMTGGMRWPLGRSGDEPMHVRFMRSANWVESIVSNPVIDKNRLSFQYNTGLSHLLSAIISANTDMNASQFASETLFRILNIEDYTWPEDPQQINYGGWGLELRCVDMAKFGMLYLEHGLFGSERVLTPEWIKKSTQAHTPDYGYQWWLHNFNGDSAFCAKGLGGQVIAVVPDTGVVMVLTSGISGRSRNQIDLLRDYVYTLVRSA